MNYCTNCGKRGKPDKAYITMFLIMFLVFSINAIMIANQVDSSNSIILGQYTYSDGVEGDKITLRIEDRNIAEIQSTFYHELGHHIYIRILSENEINRWENISQPVDDEYYENSYGESFARWFEAFYSNEDIFMNLKYAKEYDFIRRITNKYNIEVR